MLQVHSLTHYIMLQLFELELLYGLVQFGQFLTKHKNYTRETAFKKKLLSLTSREFYCESASSACMEIG